jgi:DNA-binding transcriptional LysR family regulator
MGSSALAMLRRRSGKTVTPDELNRCAILANLARQYNQPVIHMIVSLKETMDTPFSAQSQQLVDMVVLVKVVDEGSFSGAARAMGMTKSAVSKQIQRLESGFGVKLLNRTTRKLSLTEAGRVLYEHAEQVARINGAAHDALAQLSGRPTGVLRMSTSAVYGQHVLAPLLPEFCALYPDVRVALTLVDRHVDLTEEGIDLVIRLTEQPLDSLAGRPLHACDFVVCASKAFLRRKRIAQGLAWRFHDEHGQAVEVNVRGPITVNSSDMVRALVLSDMGIGLLPRFAVQGDLEAGLLKQVLPGWHPQGAFGPTAWALWQAQRHMPPKLRVMIDFLAAKLSPGE